MFAAWPAQADGGVPSLQHRRLWGVWGADSTATWLLPVVCRKCCQQRGVSSGVFALLMHTFSRQSLATYNSHTCPSVLPGLPSLPPPCYHSQCCSMLLQTLGPDSQMQLACSLCWVLGAHLRAVAHGVGLRIAQAWSVTSRIQLQHHPTPPPTFRAQYLAVAFSFQLQYLAQRFLVCLQLQHNQLPQSDTVAPCFGFRGRTTLPLPHLSYEHLHLV